MIDINDIIGKKFNMLVVKEYDNFRILNGVKWHLYKCKCECGNIKTVKRNNLIRFEVKSCGCLTRERMIDPNDIIGKKFSMLTVKKYDNAHMSKNGVKRHFYICECECGNIKTVERNSLILLKTKSCGCLLCINFNDMIGKKVGNLTVKKYDGYKTLANNKKKNHFYICECKCGNCCQVSRSNIKSTSSCGCLSHIKGKKNKGWKGFEKISGRYWNQIKTGAKSRKLEFNLDIKYAANLLESQSDCCALTGLSISLPGSKSSGYKHTASLDRIDSSKGYVANNVQWVHKDINLMKSNFPQDRFIELCLLVAKKMI